MPPRTEFLAQHAALTSAAGLAALERTLLAVTGPDRTAFLQSFTTNEVKRLRSGGGCEAFVTSAQGKTLGHVYLFCEDQRFILDSAAGQAAALVAHFQHYIITEEVEFQELSLDQAVILLAGSQAAQLLEQATGTQPPSERLDHKPISLAGQPAFIRRVEFAGPDSFFLQVPQAYVSSAMDTLTKLGAAPCDSPAVEAARIEAGFPLFGLDITPENLPQEVGRDAQAISFTKGCYLGQETVARIDAVGHVNRLLVGLKFAASDVPAGGTPLFTSEQQVGYIASACYSPRLGCPLALGYVRRGHAKPSVKLSSHAGSAEVIRLPLAS